MARYLVTGAAGFIGARVAELLLQDGHSVIGLDNLNEAYDRRLKDWRLARLQAQAGFEFHPADICDRDALAALWESEIEAVFNLAARAGVRASVRDPWVYARSNLEGTLNLLELCRSRGPGKLIQASTSSLYGAHNPRPFREDADISRPLSPYTATKGAAELMCHTYHHLHGLDIHVLRYFTVYGPAGRPDMSIFRFVQWIAEDRPVRIFGDGQQERDFTYVDDAARGTILALGCAGYEIINLGGDRPWPILEIVRQIERLLDKEARLELLPSAPGDVRATWANVEKAGKLLGWQPQVDLQAGLEACVRWYLEQRSWARDVETAD